MPAQTLTSSHPDLVAVVTGAANGIGAAIARRLIEAGISIAAVDLAPVDVSALQKLRRGTKILAYRCDVTQADEIARTCAEIVRDFGDPDILINNAGGSGPVPTPEIDQVTDEIWYHVLDLNLTSAMRFTRAFAQGMRDKRFGRIVNLSSTVRYGVPGPLTTLNGRLPYVTAKAAIVGLTRQLAKDLGPFGITVNAIAPGMILPDPEARITKKFESLPAEAQARILATIPLGRTGNGQDIADLVYYLVSPGAEFVSGETINAKGG